MAGSQNSTFENITCPFCGLACDDLKIAAKKDRLTVLANGCEISTPAFERMVPRDVPRIAGAPTDFDSAVGHAAEILKSGRRPLFCGLGTDVAGMKAILRIAERTGGTVDHMGSDALFRNIRVLQDTGWMTTTLSEVRNRADLVVFAGTDGQGFPRFFDRFIRNVGALLDDNAPRREIVYLGVDPKGVAGPGADVGDVQVIPCVTNRLHEVVAALRALVNDRSLRASEVAGIPAAELQQLSQRMMAAKYGVVVWSAGDLDCPHAELTVQALSDLVKDLNRHTRFSGLPLGGSDNSLGVNQVCTWQTGFPLRTSFESGRPDHDPVHYAWRRVLEAEEVDVLVWASAFAPISPPGIASIPIIVLGAAGAEFTKEPDVYVPVGTPGMDHSGHVFRMDGVVALPLRQLRDTDLPSVASVLASMEDALEDTAAKDLDN